MYQRIFEFTFNHWFLSIALLVVTYLLIQDLFEAVLKKHGALSPLLAVAKMNDSDTLVIDVREPPDFVDSHIEQAMNTPLSKLAELIPSLEKHKTKPVLVACQTGTLSNSAAMKLTKAGFEHVFVIAGGMTAWETDYKLPVKTSGKKK